MALKRLGGRGGWRQVLRDFLRVVLSVILGLKMETKTEVLRNILEADLGVLPLDLRCVQAGWRPEFGGSEAWILQRRKMQRTSSKRSGGDHL